MARKEKKLSPLEQRLNDLIGKYLSRISFVQKTFFIDHLRTMVHAGLSLVEALDILGREMASRKFGQVIAEVKQGVEQGQQLSEVFAKYPKVFPPMYVKMIAAGEVAGKLEDALSQVVIQMKKTQELVSSIRGAMIYPSVIVVAMGGIGILMATMILPKLIQLFKDFDNAQLPLATRILIAVTDFLRGPLNLALMIGGLIGAVTLFTVLLKKVPPFRQAVHTLNLHLPIAGPIIKQINLARFSLTLSSLLKSTIPIIEAMEITADTCGNVRFQTALHHAARELKNGKPVSEILALYAKLFPPMVTEMVMVGERSGEIDRLLSELSEFYSSEVDKTLKNFTTIIEPVIIILLGLAVAGMAVAIIMPMYTLVQNF